MRRNRFIAVGLVLLLCGPLAARPQKTANVKPSLIEKVLKIPDGAVVEVELRNAEALRGQIGGATKEGFQVQYAKEARVNVREFRYEEVKSVRKADPRLIPGMAAPTIQEKVLDISRSSRVDVELAGVERISGYITAVSDAGFTLRPTQGTANRDLAFSEVLSVRVHRSGGSKALKVIGVAALAFVVIGAIMAGRSD
jgi:hypothetical protein